MKSNKQTYSNVSSPQENFKIKLKGTVSQIIANEFISFKQTKIMKRKELMKQNKNLKENINQRIISKYSIQNTKKINLVHDDIFYSSLVINEEIFYDIPLSNSIFIPKGIYCYPNTKNFRAEEEVELKHIMKFDNFEVFDKIIEITRQSIPNLFVTHPHFITKHDRISFRDFINWIFVKNLKKFENKSQNIIDIIELIKLISEILNKRIKSVYKIISQFIFTCDFLNKQIINQSQFIKNKVETSIKKYREMYCQICFEYSCKEHCYYIKEIKEIDIPFEFQNNKLKVFKRKYHKSTGTIRFTYVDKTDFEYICGEKIFGCKFNFFDLVKNEMFTNFNLEETILKITKIIYKSNNQHNSEMLKKYLYLLSTILSSEITKNSCFLVNKMLPKSSNFLTCTEVNELIQYYQKNKLKFHDMIDKTINKPTLKEILKVYEIDKSSINNQSQSVKFQTLKKRFDYIPCNHEGKCTRDKCSCMQIRGYCEKFCSCKYFCESMFKGCQCVDGCKIKNKNTVCACNDFYRECDPDLCHKKTKGNCSCTNNQISIGDTKKICLSKSIICDYYGVFTLENIQPEELVCEYTGEIITLDESERRYVFCNYIGLNYIFGLNEYLDIDAFRYICKMRCVNHSSFGYENCYAKIKFVKGDLKIGLYALRLIRKGEELFFDYKITNNLGWLSRYNRLYGK